MIYKTYLSETSVNPDSDAGKAKAQAHIEEFLNRAAARFRNNIQGEFALIPAYYQAFCSTSASWKNCDARVAQYRTELDNIYEKVINGSNLTHGATDNASAGVAYGSRNSLICGMGNNDTECKTDTYNVPSKFSGGSSDVISGVEYFFNNNSSADFNEIANGCGSGSSSDSTGASNEVSNAVGGLIAALPSGTKASVGYQKIGGPVEIVGETGQMTSASVIKLFIAAYALSQSNPNYTDIELMIRDSNNEATNRLIDDIGMSDIDSYISSNGYSNTELRRKMGATGEENVTSSQDVLAILNKYYNHEVNGEEQDEKLIGYMKSQTVATKIRSALQGASGISYIANKTGELPDSRAVQNDTAIISTSGGDYLLAIFAQGGDSGVNIQFNIDVAKAVNDGIGSVSGDVCSDTTNSSSGDVVAAVDRFIEAARQYGSIYECNVADSKTCDRWQPGGPEKYIDEFLAGKHGADTDCTGFVADVLYIAFGVFSYHTSGDLLRGANRYLEEVAKADVQPGDIGAHSEHGWIVTKVENGEITEIADTTNSNWPDKNDKNKNVARHAPSSYYSRSDTKYFRWKGGE
jgi:beta-lactamase class A